MVDYQDIYSHSFYNQFATTLEQVVPNFYKENFLNLIYDGVFEVKEWKEQMKHKMKIMAELLPEEFVDAYEWE